MRPLGINQFAVGDPSAASVVLLLHGDGADGKQNGVVLDSGPGNLTPTRNVFFQGSKSPYAVGGGSIGLNFNADPSAERLVYSNASLALGTNNFTLELWVWKPSGITYPASPLYILGGGVASWKVGVSLAGVVRFSGPGVDISTPALITTNTWHHIAITRVAGVATIYVNGVSRVTGAISGNYTDIELAIGDYTNGSGEAWFGYISDARVVKGSAIYTANFTPPSAPLAAVAGTTYLGSYSNAGVIDSARRANLRTLGSAAISTAQSKFGGASIIVPGGSSGLWVPSLTDLVFGTGAFTVEMWFRSASLAALQVLWGQYPGSGLIALEMYVGTNGAISVQTIGAGSSITAPAGTIVANTWYHIALSRVAGQTRLFVDGVQKGATYTDPNNYVAPSYTGIGISGMTGSPANGFFDEVRVTKGVGRYAANFTPPTAPFPNP